MAFLAIPGGLAGLCFRGTILIIPLGLIFCCFAWVMYSPLPQVASLEPHGHVTHLDIIEANAKLEISCLCWCGIVFVVCHIHVVILAVAFRYLLDVA